MGHCITVCDCDSGTTLCLDVGRVEGVVFDLDRILIEIGGDDVAGDHFTALCK